MHQNGTLNSPLALAHLYTAQTLSYATPVLDGSALRRVIEEPSAAGALVEPIFVDDDCSWFMFPLLLQVRS
jgi:hypothetical protein